MFINHPFQQMERHAVTPNAKTKLASPEHKYTAYKWNRVVCCSNGFDEVVKALGNDPAIVRSHTVDTDYFENIYRNCPNVRKREFMVVKRYWWTSHLGTQISVLSTVL